MAEGIKLFKTNRTKLVNCAFRAKSKFIYFWRRWRYSMWILYACDNSLLERRAEKNTQLVLVCRCCNESVLKRFQMFSGLCISNLLFWKRQVYIYRFCI